MSFVAFLAALVAQQFPADGWSCDDPDWQVAYERDTGWSIHHLGSTNAFAEKFAGQCTWFAAAVRKDRLPMKNAAHTWYSVAEANGYAVDQVPKPGSIMVWNKIVGDGNGHVAIVVAVESNGQVTVWDCNWSDKQPDRRVRRRTIKSFKNVTGYIYWGEKRSECPAGFPGAAAVSSAILVIDRSGSIAGAPGVMQQLNNQAISSVDELTARVTRLAVINFSGQGSAKLDCQFSSDKQQILRAIRTPSVSHGGTALYEAVKSAVNVSLSRQDKPMLIVFTDGKNNQGIDLDDALLFCQQKGIAAIVIGFVGTEGRNAVDLKRFAERTGGFYEDSENTKMRELLARFAQYKKNKDSTKPDPPLWARR